MGGRVQKMKEQNKVFQNRRYCQLCLRSECKWCHACVCSLFQVIRHILKFVNIHVSTKTGVTGNNLVLHEALPVPFGWFNLTVSYL